MIYLDNAATTRPLKKAVADATRAINELYYNPSALYAGGIQTHKEISKAREELISLIADERFELLFASCGTEADNQALFGCVGRGNFVTTEGEHAAVYECAKELKRRGTDVRFASLNRDGSVKVEELLRLVDEHTSLVSVIHVNNETGAVKGTGALYKRKNLNLSPYLFGGGQEGGKRSGTENVFGILAFASAAKQTFSSLKENGARIARYREMFYEKLDKSVFSRISPQEGTPYILTVAARGLRGETLVRMLSDNGVYAGTGSACSSKKPYSRVIEACGVEKELLNGVLRFSFSQETEEREIQEGADIVNRVVKEYYGRMG